jgi:large subunit ribosomal protein L30
VSDEPRLRIEQYRSAIGRPEKHRRILRSLGLSGVNRTVERPDNAAVRGMIKKIPHLVRVVDGSTADRA